MKMLVYGAGAAWSRLEPPVLPGSGADPICSESAPGPRTSGAGAEKWRLRNTDADDDISRYFFMAK